MDLQQRRELNNGFGDSLAKAFELTVTPAIFGFLGYLLDRWVGTAPLFLLVFAVWAFGYLAWKHWGSYQRRMEAHEATINRNLPGGTHHG